jgi:hypothetical protein
MIVADELRTEAESIRASGALGRPGTLSRLFDYLLDRSLAGEAPKELEIALAVFNKNPTFDVSQDSVVRVYVHKLRRRLDDYYADAADPAASRIAIPKGEYRLTIERSPSVEAPAAVAAASPVRPFTPGSRRLTWALSLLVAAGVGALLAFASIRDRPSPEVRTVRASGVWAPLLADDLPITIVVGDYYMLGETDPEGETIERLVREFYINSPADFVYQVEASPKLMEHYRNLDLTYLPTSAAFAIQDLAPILAAKKSVRVMLMSDLNGRMLKATHIVYVGYISGLGILGDPVFAVSRLSPGGTYDELIDKTGKRQYISTAVGTGESRYTDYGYFSTFDGPDHNRIVVIAGTRDTGVMHVAEAMTRAGTLADLAARTENMTSFEALYEVHGVAKTGMTSKLVFATPTRAEGAWDAGR